MRRRMMFRFYVIYLLKKININKEDAFEKAIDMIEDFAKAQDLIIIGTLFMENNDSGDAIVRQINTKYYD